MTPRFVRGRGASILLGFLLCALAVTCSNQQDGADPRAPAALLGDRVKDFLPLPAPAFAQTAAAASGQSANLADIAERAVPSVVNISATRLSDVGQSPFSPLAQDPFFREFFGPGPFDSLPRDQRERSLGSGVIVSADGVILTSNHVVDRAEEVKITLRDGRELDAKVVGSDPQSDLAVLRVQGKATDLQPIAFGVSSALRLGDVVLAIGNPFGVGQTVTMGIVSATGRSSVGLVDYEDFIQTDAAINPGNSGGALINMRGELVGINTAILSRTGGYQGIGFAIPSDMAQPILKSLVANGKVVRGWLGVSIQELDSELAKGLGLSAQRGVLISDIEEGSPAARAGLRRGDVVIKLNEQKVEKTAIFRNQIASLGPGRVAKLEVIRDGKPRTIEVKLASRANRPGADDVEVTARDGLLGGLKVAALTPGAREKYGVPGKIRSGVVVTEVRPGSGAQRLGLREGDVIVELNRSRVDSVARFQALSGKAKKSVVLLVNRQGSMLYLALQGQEAP